MSDADESAGVALTAAEIERAEVALERWLVAQAEADVHERVLAGLLRD